MAKKEEKVKEEEVKEESQEVIETPEVVDAAEIEENAEVNVSEDVSEGTIEETAETVGVEESENIETSDTPSLDIETDKTVTIQPVKFASFEDLNQAQGETNKNLEILMDVKLQLTVELGRTELPIKKVLELTRGSIIELEKVAGEPVELYANGKLVAHGEVVVIEDNFGLRITSITEPEDRLKGI